MLFLVFPGGAEMMLFKLLCHLDKKYHPLVISLSDRNELSYLLVKKKLTLKYYVKFNDKTTFSFI